MEENVEKMQIKVSSIDQKASTLSGGNQQKVMLARWLMTQPRVLMIDEPTKGVDVGARMSVYRIIDQLTREGIAILMLTSDHDGTHRFERQGAGILRGAHHE